MTIRGYLTRHESGVSILPAPTNPTDWDVVSPEQVERIVHLLAQTHDYVILDTPGAFNELATRRDVDPKRIAIIGWCMGGGWALKLAVHEPIAKAVISNYGQIITDPAAVANLRPAILGNYGAEDRGIPPADVKAFESALKQTGHDADIKIYEGAGHGFMNPNNKEGFVPAAAADAWSRIDAFLAKHLGR